MSDTPETDAVAVIEGNWDTKALRMGDFARKLERERDALRNELNFTIRLLRTWEDDVKRISADRDYWRAEAERWQEVAK